MDMNDMVIISVDDHISEPPEMFDRHLSGEDLATAPKLRTNADGTLSERRFESQVPGVSPSAEAVAPALNKAANDVAKQVAEWVG